MILQRRIELLTRLGKYINENEDEWQNLKHKAASANPWFVPEFIEQAAASIKTQFLDQAKLEKWVLHYELPVNNDHPKKIGLVMAGNIPMVGFHDMLCIFITGHSQVIKLSSKDEELIPHLVAKLTEWDPEIENLISFAEKLVGSEVYIATGSNNSSRYFEYYFGKYPHIIRRNRTSVAILDGSETAGELEQLVDDVQMYFGLGCRNVTKLYVPHGYIFEPLLQALNKYGHFMDYHKYRHNYDYQLALLMMGNKMYMTNGSTLLNENQSLFTAISQLHYEFYSDRQVLTESLKGDEDIQCIVSKSNISFGQAQTPALAEYADGVDTMKFLMELK
ncbi:MAG: acyl-CoA reductase [Chitinophagaceae bacterium]|nr:acyl-CoA reductase [Chitinophagaceae bacterium]